MSSSERIFRPRFQVRVTMTLAMAAAISILPAGAQSIKEQASIVVAVVTDTAGHPLQGAEVQVVGTSLRGTTDDTGRIAIVAVPIGRAVLRVRRIGFAELTIPITVTSGVAADVRCMMTPVATGLRRVVVRASGLKPERYAKTGQFDEFYRRRSQGLGTFLTREIIDARSAQKSEDLLRMVTGVRIPPPRQRSLSAVSSLRQGQRVHRWDPEPRSVP